MKKILPFLLCALAGAAACAERPLASGETVLYVSGPADAGSLPAGFLATTGIRAVDLSVPETVSWALENGLPVEAPAYPALYAPEFADFQTNFLAGRSAALTEQKKRGHAKRNETKSPGLKGAEKRMAAFLASEGALPDEPGFPVSAAAIAAMIDSWELLPGAQAEAKHAKYARFLRALQAQGGDPLDVFDHP